MPHSMFKFRKKEEVEIEFRITIIDGSVLSQKSGYIEDLLNLN